MDNSLQLNSESAAEIDVSALADLCIVMEDLRRIAREANAEAGRIHRNLVLLLARFEDLAAGAESLSRRLEQAVNAGAPASRPLIDVAEYFVAELVLATDRIGAAIQEVAPALQRLFTAVAERTVRDSGTEAEERKAAVCDLWRSHWKSFCCWFISMPDRKSGADSIREQARAAIPILLTAMTSAVGLQRRVDRSNDFRTLARWFAEAESDADAHRLWRALFGLGPARHLVINDATLDDYESEAVATNASWLEAPPLRIPAHLRQGAGRANAGVMNRLIDRTAEKEKLASAAQEEVSRILAAQSRFGAGRLRLSQLEELEMPQFELLLDLLGEAMASRVSSLEPVEILSGDGSVRITLKPTGDERCASIPTAEGVLSGPDHWITIETVSEQETLEVLS